MGWRKVPQNSPTQQEFDALKARVVAVEDKCSSLQAEVDDLDARVDGLDARVAALEVVPTPEPEPTPPPTIPENTRVNLSLNTQADVNPELNPALNPNYPGNALWRGNQGWGGFGYNSFRYAPELGDLGSIIGTIGGHNDYWGNDVLRFDIATRLFAPLSDPYSSTSHPGSFHIQSPWGHSDNANGELFINASFATDQTQPVSFHSYGTNVVLPPDSSIGVGPKGALLSCIRASRTPDSGNPTGRTHIFDLAQSNRATSTWQRYSTNVWAHDPPEDRFSYGWAVYDPTRKKVFMGVRGNFYNKLSVLNCVTRLWETPLTLSRNVYMFHSGAWHWAENPDYIINFICEGGSTTLELINVATGQVYTPGTTGTGPPGTGGFDFVQSANKLAIYESFSSSRVWTLTPPSLNPATFTTTPWAYGFEDVTGPTPPTQPVDANHIGRFLWAEKAKCFIWWANGVDSVQAWKVKGFLPGPLPEPIPEPEPTPEPIPIPSPSGLIVDEVASESLVTPAGHPDVIWRGNFQNKTEANADWAIDPATLGRETINGVPVK
jgi:hypothetical protein